MIDPDSVNLSKSSQKVDVCLVAENYYPVLTGAGERFRRYAPGLRTRGIQLRIITVNRDNRSNYEIIDGTPILRFKLPETLNFFAGSGSVSAVLLRNAIDSFHKNKNYPDVLHILTHTLQGAVYVWRARLDGIPCINSITLMPVETRTKSEHIKNFLHHWLRYSPFNLVVTNNQVMTRRMTQLGISAKRIATISNGVNLTRFRPASSPEEKAVVRQKLGLGIDAEIILYVGYIIPRKGIDLLIEAWSEIAHTRPKAHLVLVGPYENKTQPETLGQNPTSFYAKLRSIIQKSEAPDRVSFIGEIPDVDSYLQAADLFVFPSRQEGSPNAVMEAMAAGLPCVLTPFKGLSAELGAPDREFLIASFSPESIAKNIFYLLSNHSLRLNLGLASRKFAQDHFDVEQSLDQYAELYFNLARKRKRK